MALEIDVARRDDMPLGRRHKPADKVVPQHQQEQEADQEQVAEQEQPEHSRAQDLFGNAALASALSGASVAGAAGIDGNVAMRRDPDREGLQLGGDDDDDGDVPLTIEDLTRDWDRGGSTRKAEESTSFVEPMPYDDLPQPDAAWLAQVRALPAPERPQAPEASLIDGLLQPSDLVFTGPAMRAWLVEAARWARPDALGRVLAATLSGGSPLLQDPWGRVMPARVRAGAAATLMLVDGPALTESDDHATALLQLCLELAGGRRRVDEVHEDVRARGEQLPLTRAVLAHHLPPTRDAAPEHRDDGLATSPALVHVSSVLEEVLGISSAVNLVPDLPDPDASRADADDPLGLDDVLAEFTGGRPDPRDGAYQAALVAAERLAGTTALLRVRSAGAAVAAADTADSWIAGPAYGDLAAFGDWLDRESKRVLSLVVEVARAIRARSVEPGGVRNGLRRAARMLDRLRGQAVGRLARVAVSTLPSQGALPPPPERADDALRLALADGRPTDALPWVETVATGVEATAATELLRAMALVDPPSLGPALLAAAGGLRERGRHSLATALEVCAGPMLVAGHAHGDALRLATEHVTLGWRRRNGLLVAAGGLLAMEVHRATADSQREASARLESGHLAYHLGAWAAVEALARWTPPPEEP